MRLIDADAWKSFYQKMLGVLEVYDPYYDGYEDALNNVDDWMDAQPTIDPVKRGVWVHKSWWQHKNHYEVKSCSICGFNVKPKHEYNYCPCCGADMRGGTNDG